MTDTDQHIEQRLQRAGSAFRAQPVAEAAVTWPSRRSRGQRLAPLAVAAAVAAVVAGVAIVVGTRHSTAPAAPPLQPDRDFSVAAPPAPVVGPIGTGGMWPNPACPTASLKSSLKTRTGPDGVLGLIRVWGVKCSVQVDENRLRLLDAKGDVLPVAESRGNPVNQPGFYGPGAGGDVRMGFAWTGSYCGPRPAGVRILVAGHPVVIPFTGPTPACNKKSTSRLVEGSLGVPGEAVMPAPAAWQSLTARVVLPDTLSRAPVPLTVEFTNHGKQDISLAVPCPAYRVILSTNTTGSNVAMSSQGQSTGDLCGRPITVTPRKAADRLLGHGRFPTDECQDRRPRHRHLVHGGDRIGAQRDGHHPVRDWSYGREREVRPRTQ